MKKKYAGRSPWRRETQDVNINKAIMRMLNCRRYLASKGFSELFSDDTIWYSNNPVNNISGSVIFPDGSEVSSNAFIKMSSTSERDSLLERMILKEGIFKRRGINVLALIGEGDSYRRDNVIRTTYSNNKYEFTLSVIDTTKEGVIFPVNMFIFSPKSFALRYDIFLEKAIISDDDLKSFEKYRSGLASAAQQDALVTYDSQASQRKKQLQKPIKTKPIKTDFINPWETEIPEAEDIIKKLNGEK